MGNKTCKRGHVRTPENTVERFGLRTCTDCEREKRPGASRRGAKTGRTRRASTPVAPASDEALYASSRAVVLDGFTTRRASREWDVPEERVRREAWSLAKALVRQRDADRCWRCGAYGEHDVHHRRGRGSGGTGDSRIGYGLANLILLDRSCHEWAEANFDAAVDSGWRLASGSVPEDVPVLDARTGDRFQLTHRGTKIGTR